MKGKMSLRLSIQTTKEIFMKKIILNKLVIACAVIIFAQIGQAGECLVSSLVNNKPESRIMNQMENYEGLTIWNLKIGELDFYVNEHFGNKTIGNTISVRSAGISTSGNFPSNAKVEVSPVGLNIQLKQSYYVVYCVE